MVPAAPKNAICIDVNLHQYKAKIRSFFIEIRFRSCFPTKFRAYNFFLEFIHLPTHYSVVSFTFVFADRAHFFSILLINSRQQAFFSQRRSSTFVIHKEKTLSINIDRKIVTKINTHSVIFNPIE